MITKSIDCPELFSESADSDHLHCYPSRRSVYSRYSEVIMQKFDYRAPRFSVDIPVELTIENSTHVGRCREISIEGMRLELREPLPLNSVGTVTMSHEFLSLKICVRVTHAKSDHDGLKFIFECDDQRNDLAHLVTLLSDSRKRSGPILVR